MAITFMIRSFNQFQVYTHKQKNKFDFCVQNKIQLASRLFTEVGSSPVKNIPVEIQETPSNEIAGKFPKKKYLDFWLKRRFLIFKIVIQFRKLHQNVQRYQNKTQSRKEQFGPILAALYIGYKFLSSVQCTLKLLLKNCIN